MPRLQRSLKGRAQVTLSGPQVNGVSHAVCKGQLHQFVNLLGHLILLSISAGSLSQYPATASRFFQRGIPH